MFKLCLIVAWIGVLQGYALAANCDDMTGRPLAECMEKDADKADADLNAIYKQVISRLKSENKDVHPLVVAERSWIARRDKHCDQEAADYVNSTADVVRIGCFTDATQSRIRDLQKYR